jgi:hypothetical protein
MEVWCPIQPCYDLVTKNPIPISGVNKLFLSVRYLGYNEVALVLLPVMTPVILHTPLECVNWAHCHWDSRIVEVLSPWQHWSTEDGCIASALWREIEPAPAAKQRLSNTLSLQSQLPFGAAPPRAQQMLECGGWPCRRLYGGKFVSSWFPLCPFLPLPGCWQCWREREVSLP